MRILNKGAIAVLICLSFASAGLLRADQACEKKIRDTGMIYKNVDPAVICRRNPNPDTQQCIVDILGKSRGKLRNSDLMDVSGFCKMDSSPWMRDCMIRGFQKKWNEPGYKSARVVGAQCSELKFRARLAAARQKTTQSTAANSASTKAQIRQSGRK